MSSPLETYKIYIAADHAGFSMKRALAEGLRARGYAVVDMGAHAFDSEDDYPEYVTPCAMRVAEVRTQGDTHAFGVVIGGSGQGEAMAANRVRGARAAVFYGGARAKGTLDAEGAQAQDALDIVRLARAHNDANILSLGARFLTDAEALAAVELFLRTPFSGAAHHARRIAAF